MTSTLANKKCVPCEGDMSPFTRNQIQGYIVQRKDWSVVENKAIEKNFQFKNFKKALVFINKVGEIAESEGHHPDIYLHGYNKVRITLSTHALKGLSENDFILAAKIDTIS